MCSPATSDVSLLDSFTDSQNNHQWPVVEFLNRKTPKKLFMYKLIQILISVPKSKFINELWTQMENHEKNTEDLYSFSVTSQSSQFERIVLLTVRPDLVTESSFSGCDIVIRILKGYPKNKTENFLFLSRNTSKSFHQWLH